MTYTTKPAPATRTARTPSHSGTRYAVNEARGQRITKLAVLKAAAAFGASRPDCKSDQVLQIAERWLAWVEA